MNRLEALKAALEYPSDDIVFMRRGGLYGDSTVVASFPADTIAALIAVARDAKRQADDPMVGCPFCGCYTADGHDEDCPLAPLVKEEADDRA